jgi:hypothetical protein
MKKSLLHFIIVGVLFFACVNVYADSCVIRWWGTCGYLCEESCWIDGGLCIDNSGWMPTSQQTRTQEAALEVFNAIFRSTSTYNSNNECYTWGEPESDGYTKVCINGTWGRYLLDLPYVEYDHGGWDVICGPETDTDGDGVIDIADNCPDVYNPDQEDLNGTGIGDTCETTTTTPTTVPPTTTGPTTTTTTSIIITTTIYITSTTSTSILADCAVYVSVSPPEGGTTNPPPGSYFLQGCTTRCLTFTAIPNPGYSFSHWKEGVEISTENPRNICGWGEAVFGKIPTTTTTTSKPCAAETIYGENSEQTELLRKYRDTVLSKTPEGQEVIKTYYKFSPTVTNLLEQRPLLKNRAKAFIDSMLPGIRNKVEETRREQ